MTLVVKHAFVSGVADDPSSAAAGEVLPSHWDASHALTGTADASQLNGNVVQSVVNDTNITGSISGQALTFSWSGTLAAGRLNSNVVQAVTNDTNVQGSISGQALTFSWSGKLGLSRGGTNADLSATGGTSQVLKQSSSGASVTVGQLAFTDISGNIAVSQMNSGTGAAYSTFWRGDGVWDSMPYVTLEMFGGKAAVGTDNTPALNAAVAFCNTSTIKTIRLLAGNYYFATKPTAITNTVIIKGESSSETYLIRNYSASSTYEGFIAFSGSGSNGSRLENLQINAGNGTSNGALMAITTGTNDVAGYHAIKDCVFSFLGTGDYTNCLYVDGTANQTVGSQGLRDLIVADCFFFHGNVGTECVRILNATNHCFSGFWSNGTCTVSGGGTSLTNTTVGVFDGSVLGQVFVSNATLVSFYGNYNSLIFSTGTTNCFDGASYPSGSFSDSGTGNITGGNIFIGATSGAAGYTGLVPKPAAGQQNAVLQGVGSWSSFSFTGTAGKTLTFNNSLTLAGADGTIITFQGTDTYVGRTTTDTLTNKTITSAVASGTWAASGTWTLPAITLGGTVSANGQQINWTSTPAQYGSAINLRGEGGATASVEWGHSNTSGYGNTFGFEGGSGAGYIAFSAGPGTTSNTYKTFGVKGSLIKSDNAGGWIISSIQNANADNQTPTTILTVDTNSNVAAGSFLANAASGGIGYKGGSGGAVTQVTSRSTGVTINTITGAITLFSAAGSATATTFTVTNSSVAAADVIHINQKSGTNLYEIFITAVAAGSFNVTFLTTSGTATDAPVFNFVVIKGSTN